MSTITLEEIQTKHAEVAALIEKFKLQPAVLSVLFTLAAASFELKAGERYAGAVLNEDGTVKHHLVLLAARPDEDLDWAQAKNWAASVGGELPDRQEQALLYANCKAALPQRWCWSSEANGSSYAWGCDFDDGSQINDHQSYEGGAVAVRRVNP